MVLRYLKGRKCRCARSCQQPHLPGHIYADASFADIQPERLSSMGYVFIINNGAVSWRSTRPPLSHSVLLRAKLLPSPPPLKKQFICANLQTNWVSLKLHPLPTLSIAPLPLLSLKRESFRESLPQPVQTYCPSGDMFGWSFVSERQHLY